ncbi:MAG: T9SS type A sorting domain-containing protein [Bacteroidota bacterium]
MIRVSTLFLVVSYLLLCSSTASAKEPGKAPKNPVLQKSAIQEWNFFDVNSLNATINSSGPYCDYLKTNSSGLEWPKGTKKTAVFTAGLWVIGKHKPTGHLRTAVQNYQTEYQPGPILSTFNTTTNSTSVLGDPSDPHYKIYKVHRKDSLGGNPDYDNWPVHLGAPYTEVNGTPGYQPGSDKPFLWGDQVMWVVYNDGNPAKHIGVGATNPMGIEIQTTYFGFDQSGPLGNTMFMRWKIINKSDADYDSVFFSQWSDTDMGDANDDMAACDTIRKLTYTYNGDNDDGSSAGYGAKPPADGFVFFQGPKVAGSSGDTALFEGLKIPGYRNLSAASHAAYFGGGIWNDPSLGSILFAEQAYNYQRGLIGSTGQPFINPQTNQPSHFVFPGDPVTGTGWTQDKSAINPGDVRAMISSGPFTLAKGDTQEIVGGFVIAQGNNRLESITKLREYVDFAQFLFDRNFAVPFYSSVNTEVKDNEAVLTVKVSGSGYKSMSAAFRTENDALIIETSLYDDGLHGDAAAGDGTFGIIQTIPPQPMQVQIDITTIDNADDTMKYVGALSNIQTTNVTVSSASLVAEQFSNDGQANPNEVIRLALTLVNKHSIPFTEVKISSPQELYGKSILINTLTANTIMAIPYQANDNNSYITVRIPSGFSDPTYPVTFELSDHAGNTWKNTIEIPVTPYVLKKSALTRTHGTTKARFNVIVSTPALTKDKEYLIYGIDSINTQKQVGFGVKEAVNNNVLYQNKPINDIMGVDVPVVDGFKVVNLSADSAAEYKWIENLNSANPQWFSSASGRLNGYGVFLGHEFPAKINTSLKKFEFHDLNIRFEPFLSYTDKNGNGKYTIGEPYVVDSNNASKTQWAYIYRQESVLLSSYHFVGMTHVPFIVRDISTDPPRQLDVILWDNNKNGQWDIDSVANGAIKDYLYIFDTEYDATGSRYNPDKGGTDLTESFKGKQPLPVQWVLWLNRVVGLDPYMSLNVNVVSSGPLTSNDTFSFNPSKYTGVQAFSGEFSSFELEQNYPNPFNPSTTIRYAIPSASKVTLKVFNILGQQIAELVNTVQTAGRYESLWSPNVASGMYFYKIEAVSTSDPNERFTQLKKMVLLK